MMTKNTYSKPIDEKYITGIKYDSPTHRKFFSEKYKAFVDLTHAIDYSCNIGTPIKAMLNGEVVYIVDGLTKNYDKFKPEPTEEQLPEDERLGNFIWLKHKNNEFSEYAHLNCKGIIVKAGQEVKTGQVLGYSGHTGWSIKPHLHFLVFRFLKPMPAKDRESLEIKWKK